MRLQNVKKKRKLTSDPACMRTDLHGFGTSFKILQIYCLGMPTLGSCHQQNSQRYMYSIFVLLRGEMDKISDRLASVSERKQENEKRPCHRIDKGSSGMRIPLKCSVGWQMVLCKPISSLAETWATICSGNQNECDGPSADSPYRKKAKILVYETKHSKVNEICQKAAYYWLYWGFRNW